MMVGSFTLGLLADRIGRKKVTILCLTLFSVFTGICGFVNDPVLFAVFRFIAGLGIGGAMPNAIGLLSDYAPLKQRNTLLATCTTGMQIGGILAPAISIAAVPTLGCQFCFFIGFIPLIALPFMLVFLPDSLDHLMAKGKLGAVERILKRMSPQTNAATVQMTVHASENDKSPIVELFRNKRTINTVMFWLAFFMSLLMIYGLNTWLPMLMTNAGYGHVSSLTFLIVLNSVGLIGSVVIGRIADKGNPQAVLRILYLVGAASLLLLSIDGGITYTYIIISVCGLCIFGCQNMSIAFVAQCYPGRIRTTGLGIANTIGRVGGILGPTLGGVLMAAKLPMFFNCLSISIPGVLASAAYFVVKSKRGRDERDALTRGGSYFVALH